MIPEGQTENIPRVDLNSTQVENIFSAVLAVAGALCVIYIIYNGIRFVISGNDPNVVKQARLSILYALIGLVIVSLAFTLVRFVIFVGQGE